MMQNGPKDNTTDQSQSTQPDNSNSDPKPKRDRGSFFQINIFEATGLLILSVFLYNWMFTDPSMRYHRAVQDSQTQVAQ